MIEDNFIPNWKRGENIGIVWDDKTAEKRSPEKINAMFEEMRSIANKNNFDLNMWGWGHISGFERVSSVKETSKPHNFKLYDNILYFSMENNIEGKDLIASDIMIQGDLLRLAAGLAQEIIRHPELGDVFMQALIVAENMDDEDKKTILNPQ